MILIKYYFYLIKKMVNDKSFYINEILFIEKMIKSNIAYPINIENKGTYICMMQLNNNNIRNNIPIQHKEITNEHKKNESDYVVWIPGNDEHCHESPWGSGKPSANLFVISMYK